MDLGVWERFGDWFWGLVHPYPWDPGDSDYGSEG